jgi:hypothetical protein
VGGSTSAGAAPAGLALASAAFKQPGYLRVARAAAEQLHDRYLRAGITCGGPGDALQCPDSESAAALLESFVTLYEVTRERVWIDRARAAAHLLASWVIAHEPADAARTAGAAETARAAGAGRRTLRATGGVLSDAQNDRGTPGYMLWSGDALFRLYRATGEVALLELLRDTVHNLPQYLRVGADQERDGSQREQGGAAPERGGAAAEQGTSAAERGRAAGAGPAGPRGARTDTARWLEQPGEIVPAAVVFDAIALLAYTEVPGVYAAVDSGFVFAFDHVDARVKERLAGKLVVALANPTRVDATVRVFAETVADASEPLQPGAVVEAPTVSVPAGATVDVALPLPRVARR